MQYVRMLSNNARGCSSTQRSPARPRQLGRLPPLHSPAVHAPLPALTSPHHRPLLPGTTGHSRKRQGRHEQSRARGGRRAIPPRRRRPVGTALLSSASPPTADTRLTSPPLPAATPPRPTLSPRYRENRTEERAEEGFHRGAAPLQSTPRPRGGLRWEQAWRGGLQQAARAPAAAESRPCWR